MDVTRERISRILELREMLPSFQTGFSLVDAAVVRAILESISGLEFSSVISEPRYLNLWQSQVCVHLLWSLHVLMPLVLFVISLVFSALISMPWTVEALSRLSANFASSSSSPAKPRCHQQKGDWLLFCLQCWQSLCDLPRRAFFPNWLKNSKCNLRI